MKLLHETVIRERITELVSKNDKPDKLTIFLQTSRIWQENQQAKIQLKNLLDEAVTSQVSPVSVKKVRNFLDETTVDETFWRTTQEGLAIFSSEDDFEYFILPHEFKNECYVGTHFNVKPLTPFIQMDLQYYVLVLSKKTVKAFKGHNRKLEQLDTSNIPQNIEEMLWMDDPEKSIQHETGKGHGPGSQGGTIYHGHGDFSTVKRSNLRRYINYLDDYIGEVFMNKDLPLVLVTDQPNYDIFRGITKYPKVYEYFVDTNPDQMNEQSIKDDVWDLIVEAHEDEKYKFFGRYKDSLGTPLTAYDIPTVVTAAFQQRVDTLFVDPNVEVWGSFDVENTSVSVTDKDTKGSYELLNYVITHTLLNGGRVFDMTVKKIKNKSPLAAIFRF